MTKAPMGKALGFVVLVAVCGGCAITGTPASPAVGPQSSWEEIRGTPDLMLNPPVIRFGARAVSVMDVCRGGDQLRATTADGTALETPVAGHGSTYTIQVGRIVGDAETSKFRALFVKSFEVPPCR
jgi:hypothetical protein